MVGLLNIDTVPVVLLTIIKFIFARASARKPYAVLVRSNSQHPPAELSAREFVNVE